MSQTTVADKPAHHPKTTYYNSFPRHPRPGCSLVHVLWVVANDYRTIHRNERRNVIYPAKAAGMIIDAPTDTRGVKVNMAGETSRCHFVLTQKGRDYYDDFVKPILPEGFTSAGPLPKRRRSTAGLSTEDLKAGLDTDDDDTTGDDEQAHTDLPAAAVEDTFGDLE